MELIVNIVEIKLHKLNTQRKRRKRSTAVIDNELGTSAGLRARQGEQA